MDQSINELMSACVCVRWQSSLTQRIESLKTARFQSCVCASTPRTYVHPWIYIIYVYYLGILFRCLDTRTRHSGVWMLYVRIQECMYACICECKYQFWVSVARVRIHTGNTHHTQHATRTHTTHTHSHTHTHTHTCARAVNASRRDARRKKESCALRKIKQARFVLTPKHNMCTHTYIHTPARTHTHTHTHTHTYPRTCTLNSL